MKKYKIVNKVRFWRCIGIGVILIGGILFLNTIKNKEYKNDNSIYILTEEQQEFFNSWNGIPTELRDWMDTYEEEFQYLDIPLSKELQDYTYKMCKKYNVDYMFVMGIMATESSFNTKAKCKNNTDRYYSRGLLQLNERYTFEFAELTGIKDFNINNVYHNIEGGVAKLAKLKEVWSQYELSEEDNWYAVTNSYNLGYDKYKRQVISRGVFFSREYDRKVLRNKEKLEGGIY